MKINLKGKGLFKTIALALAGVAALTGVGFGVKAIVDYTKNDLKTISPSFEVGNLGADGKFVDDESTLYTKDAFKCDGLQVKLDFDNQINYQIFYYDDLDNFVSSSTVMESSFEGRVLATSARLVIIPTNDEDNKISWTEKISYPKQMTVKIAKEQKLKYVTSGTSKMFVVYNQFDLLFKVCNLDIDSDNSIIIKPDDTSRACTSVNFLDVSTYKTISILNNLSSGENLSLWIAQFGEKDGKVNLISKGVQVEDEVVFEKGTKYILLVCGISSGENEEYISLAGYDITKFNSCFALK